MSRSKATTRMSRDPSHNSKVRESVSAASCRGNVATTAGFWVYDELDSIITPRGVSSVMVP